MIQTHSTQPLLSYWWQREPQATSWGCHYWITERGHEICHFCDSMTEARASGDQDILAGDRRQASASALRSLNPCCHEQVLQLRPLCTGEVGNRAGITRANHNGLGHLSWHIFPCLWYVGMHTDASLESLAMEVATTWTILVVLSQLY